MRYSNFEISEIGTDPIKLREFIENLPKIDLDALENKSKIDYSSVSSIESKRENLQLLTSLIDLTTLEGSDTNEKIRKIIVIYIKHVDLVIYYLLYVMDYLYLMIIIFP